MQAAQQATAQQAANVAAKGVSQTGSWSRPVDRQANLMARAQAVKAAGVPARSGVGAALQRLQTARAAGLRHTGAGQRLRKRLAGLHPDAKNVNWY